MQASRRGFLQASFSVLAAGSVVCLGKDQEPERLQYRDGFVLYAFQLDQYQLSILPQDRRIRCEITATQDVIVCCCDLRLRYLLGNYPQIFRSQHPITPIQLVAGETLILEHNLHIQPYSKPMNFYGGESLVYVGAHKGLTAPALISR